MQCQIDEGIEWCANLDPHHFTCSHRSRGHLQGPFKATGNGGQQRHHEKEGGTNGRTAGAEVDDESHAMMDAEAKCGKMANFDGGKG